MVWYMGDFKSLLHSVTDARGWGVEPEAFALNLGVLVELRPAWLWNCQLSGLGPLTFFACVSVQNSDVWAGICWKHCSEMKRREVVLELCVVQAWPSPQDPIDATQPLLAINQVKSTPSPLICSTPYEMPSSNEMCHPVHWMYHPHEMCHPHGSTWRCQQLSTGPIYPNL